EELTEAVEELEAGAEFEEDEETGEEVEYEAAEAGAAGEGGGSEEDTASRAELRAPAGTAGYQQRAQRPPFERRGRGRRGGRRNMRPSRPMQRQQVMISDMLKEGQEIVVQIAKEPIGKMGARITSHIALPGRFLVYMPTVNHIGVSRKIDSDDERQRLKRIVMGERDVPGHGGFIVRTAAENVAEDELRADIRFLKNLWNEVKNRADNSKAPALIYHDLNLVERTLRDQLTEDFTHVWVDNEQEYERVLRFVNRFQPNLVRRVRLYTKEAPLFEQFGIQDEINKALKSKVWLKSGGYIVINQTEALVAIDVNTGKYVGKTSRLEDTIVKTNVDAIKEIVRQIRLRDLGGIIVIDFIDMDERKNRQKVMQALAEALKSDRAPSKVLQFNDFGLVAITRKRVKHSLERTLGNPCPYCTGTGLVKSVETVCNEIYVEMKKMRRHLEGHEIMLRVNPEVAKELKANNARWLNDLEELTGKSIIIKPDATLHQEQFDM
ncbi:MAG: Rne/Rng family ribonuclease, partial [Terriglobales bacterium]